MFITSDFCTIEKGILSGVLAADTATVRLSTNGYTATFASAGTNTGIGVTVSGLIPGTSGILVRRHDGLDWAVLFNADRTPKGVPLASQIDSLVHVAADAVRTWPAYDLFRAP